jgi:hypothetical protein
MKKIRQYTILLGILLNVFYSCGTKNSSLFVNFDDTSTNKWAITELNSELPNDWSSYKYLTFDIFATSTQRFNLILHDKEGKRIITILPFQDTWVRASIPLIHLQKRNVIGHDMAAIGKTALPGMCINFTGIVGSINNVDSISFEMNRPLNSPSLEIKNVQLTMVAMDSILSPLPTVNKYGQWIPGNSDIFSNDSELADAWLQDDKDNTKGDFGFSKYGGFIKQKVLGSGFFRTERINNRWWLIDPDGYLFYSIGSTGINPGIEFARVDGREYIYEELPPLIKGTGERFEKNSYYTWNLTRRYGENGWVYKWIEKTVGRMDRWGFNTIANWSDETLCNSQQKAYVKNLRSWGFNAETMGMPDPYDPEYTVLVDSLARIQCEPLKNDPYLIGYFVGNEPPWPGRENELVEVILNGNESPLQTALKEFLEKEDSPAKRKEFVYKTYDKFIRLINNAIKKYDPNHLNLGLRFGGNPPEEILAASANVGFDVFSLNVYSYRISDSILEKIDNYTDLPIIIGEFHFGTPEKGLAPGLAQTINQKERGIAYSYYVENAAAHPSVVGTHWFQWLDQPSTGRYDGENYNIGFIDVTDLPHTELVNEAINTHEKIFEIHSGNIQPTSIQAKIQ